MDVMADDSFKILVDYGQLNEVRFVSMTCHQIVYCTAVVLHTFLQKYTFHWNFVNNGEKQTTGTVWCSTASLWTKYASYTRWKADYRDCVMFNSFIMDKIHFIHKMKSRLQELCDVQQLHYGQNTLHTQDEKQTTGTAWCSIASFSIC